MHNNLHETSHTDPKPFKSHDLGGDHVSSKHQPHENHLGAIRPVMKRFSWHLIPSLLFALSGVILLAVSMSRLASLRLDPGYSQSGAAQDMILDTGKILTHDIERVVRPAMRRGQIIANSESVITALSNDDTETLTRICNDIILNSTEIDAVALYTSYGEITAINTLYSNGDPIEQHRIDQVLSRDFSDRDIIMNCVKDDMMSELLEFQSTCDISPAFFDSKGLSVAHSIPVFNKTGEKVGIVSTRLRFERLESLLGDHEIAQGRGTVLFITDEGQVFDEEARVADHPPVPVAELSSITAKMISQNREYTIFDRDETTYMLFRANGLTTMDGGGIQAMIGTPHDWLRREAHDAALIAVATPGVFGVLFSMLWVVHRSYLKIRSHWAIAQWNLGQSRALTETIERARDATIITDKSGRIQYVNAAARQFGEWINCSTNIGDQALFFNSDWMGTDFAEELQKALMLGQPFSQQIEFKPINDKNGSSLQVIIPSRSIWMEISAFALTSEHDNEGKIVYVMHDISDEVGLEEQARGQAKFAEIRFKISAVLSEDGVLRDRISRSLNTLFKIEQLNAVDTFGVYLLDDSESVLELIAQAGRNGDEHQAEQSSIELGSCPYSEALSTDSSVIHSEAGGTGYRYILPISEGSICVGVLFFDSVQKPVSDPVMLDVLNQIGTLIAKAVLNDWHEKCSQETNEHLVNAQIRYELAIKGSRDAIFDWDISNDEVFYSSRWAELLGCDSKVLKPSISTLLEHASSSDVRRVEDSLNKFVQFGQDHFEIEFRLMTTEGRVVWALLRAAASRDKDGVANRVSGSVADISKLKEVEKEMRRLIQQDQLTGLASRSKLLESLDRAIAQSKRTGTHIAVLFFDFDRFKVVNDSLGHDAGDELLCNIAARLKSEIRETDTAARFGGDEFVILLENLPDSKSARKMADNLLQICAKPHQIRGHHIVSTASIGVVTTEMSSCDSASMLRDADAAMYQAKSQGRGRVVEFDKAMLDASVERLAIEADIRDALASNQFSLHYQPIIDLENGEPIGAEALARWNHPIRGYIPPDVFIEIAEESNQIAELGDFVLREACRQVVDWKRRKVIAGGFTISVNLSKVQLTVPGFVGYLSELISQAGLTPKDIKLEVTETTIVDNRAGIVHVLTELRELGFIIMMDDFGTGHSSLSGLHSLPIDELKIDQSFIRHENATKETIAITSSIVTLADHLSMRTVGEGIESADHISLLQNLGCHYGQGYFFSKPLPSEMFEAWLSSRFQSHAA